jgi:hypothetical protein
MGYNLQATMVWITAILAVSCRFPQLTRLSKSTKFICSSMRAQYRELLSKKPLICTTFHHDDSDVRLYRKYLDMDLPCLS